MTTSIIIPYIQLILNILTLTFKTIKIMKSNKKSSCGYMLEFKSNAASALVYVYASKYNLLFCLKQLGSPYSHPTLYSIFKTGC